MTTTAATKITLKPWVTPLLLALFAFGAGSGCRQKMAEQPYHKPYEESEFFADMRSNRPLERGVIHRGQFLETDSLVTGLTSKEWDLAYEYAVPAKPDTPPLTDAESIKRAVGAPRYDQRIAANLKVYVDEFPFAITKDDLTRGQERYTIYCAVCHGPLGNGQGKIWERGYLTPTSFHTTKVDKDEVDMAAKTPRDNPHGYSRGYGTWGIQIPMRDVSVGYLFEVITKGYGGMPSYSAQISPADRWKIIAYIKVLQLSQRTPAASLSKELRDKVDGGGKP